MKPGFIHSLDWTTGLDYWTDHELFPFGQVLCLFLEASLHFYYQEVHSWLLWMNVRICLSVFTLCLSNNPLC